MSFVTRAKFWLLALSLLCYIIAVVILSTISLHGFKKVNFSVTNRHYSPSERVTYQESPTHRRTKSDFDYHGGALSPVMKRSRVQWCSRLTFIPSRENISNSTKPVALASFPGSGNTWLRYLLQQASGYFTGSVYKDYGLQKNGFPAESITNNSVLVVKTHEWGANARSMFSKALLLVRSPERSIQAEFNRQSGGHIGFAPPERYRRSNGKYWKHFVNDGLRGWHHLNMDWLFNFTGPIHVIFYEQLVDNTEYTLKTVIDFLGVSIRPKMFQCAIDRKEGSYRRKKRLLKFDPFTEDIKAQIKEVQEKVYGAIYRVAAPEKNNS